MSRMQRMRVRLPAVIALGGNLGDRERALRDAVAAIGELSGVVLTAASDIVESAALTPHGVDEARPAYLNAVVAVRTDLTPEELLEELAAIETRLGRVRGERWGDRVIDLDLIVVDGLERRTDRLVLPHPRVAERAFVLEPWRRMDPAAVLPGHGAVADLADAATDTVRTWPAAPLLPGADVPEPDGAHS